MVKVPTQRYRDGDHGNDRRPPGLQEQEDDADHEGDRDENRLDDFVDGLAHEGRRIVDVDVVETGREALLELRHLVPDLVLDLDDVRSGRGDRKPRGGRIPVGISDGAVVHRAEFDAADVTDAGDAPLVVRLDDDVAELFGRRESAERLDVDLVGRRWS